MDGETRIYPQSKKTKRTPNSHARIDYTDELSNLLKDNLRMKNEELMDLVKKTLGIDMTNKQVSDFFYTRGLGPTRKKAKENDKPLPINNPPERSNSGRIITGKKQLFPEKIQDFIEKNWVSKTDRELRAIIGDDFGKWYTAEQIKSMRKKRGWTKGSFQEKFDPENLEEVDLNESPDDDYEICEGLDDDN